MLIELKRHFVWVRRQYKQLLTRVYRKLWRLQIVSLLRFLVCFAIHVRVIKWAVWAFASIIDWYKNCSHLIFLVELSLCISRCRMILCSFTWRSRLWWMTPIPRQGANGILGLRTAPITQNPPRLPWDSHCKPWARTRRLYDVMTNVDVIQVEAFQPAANDLF